jgi:hypothetical protein
VKGVSTAWRGTLALLTALLLTAVGAGSHARGGAMSAQRPARLAAPGAQDAHANAAAPHCDNGGHAQSMLLAGALTVSPEPGALDAAPQTQISLLGVPAGDLSDVTVTGSRSGAHGGRLEPYSLGDGASFLPSSPFDEGEQVTVRLDLLTESHRGEISWSFRVFEAVGVAAVPQEELAVTQARARAQHFRSQPNLRPPVVDVKLDRGPPRPGYLFMSPYSAGQPGPMILNDRGQVVWFHPVDGGRRAATKASDLQVQRYRGRPVLTWWEDPLVAAGSKRRELRDVIFDQSYQRIAVVHAGNGFEPGLHAFTLTSRGTALIEANRDIRCDLAGVGATPDGSLWDNVIQEIDIKNGLVRWEWSSLDHVALEEAYASARHSSPTYPFDFFHLNSIQELSGNRLLISSRNTWTIYELDRLSGAIRFRLGGKHSSFAMGPGTRTAYQHDADALTMPGASGRMLLSVFDNGGTPQVHSQSRALVEDVNLSRRTVRLLRSLTHPSPLLSPHQGSVQVLPGGHTLVGWGQDPWVTEYNQAGRPIFDAHLAPVEQSFRALRFAWDGRPTGPPSAAAVLVGRGRLVVYASWNGSTGVARWRVLEGSSPSDLRAVASGPRTGFETRIIAPRSGSLIQVQALDGAGQVLRATKALTPGPSGSRETFSAAGANATEALLDVFYAGGGRWQLCSDGLCGKPDDDWGADSLTFALVLREQTTQDPHLIPVLAALAAAAPSYPAPCEGAKCTALSDIPEWDTIALAREYEATHDPADLAKAEAAFQFVQGSTVFSLGACPDIRYQQPYGGSNHLKTLETDGNAIKGALLLYRDTGLASYLDDARERYADVRQYFLDTHVPLYTSYVFDNGRTCSQLPHRFFASVNGDMIWNGLELYRATGQRTYLQQALATARAVSADLNDALGIFTDLQAENDVVEPLVEAMYDLAVEEHATFARRWIVKNAAAALGERRTNGLFGRFFDGPQPTGTVTAWQANGAIVLEIAAAALAPSRVADPPPDWGTWVYVPKRIARTPAHITFQGKGIALVGTIGEKCCESGHVRVFVDGKQTFDRTGIWQNKSSAGIRIPRSILFSWRWPRPGRHTIEFGRGIYNPKEGTSFVHIRGYFVILANRPP